MREERSDSRIIKLKLNHRRRMIRIKLSDFNDEKELMNEFKNISKNLTQK